ncbi:MAG TPA: ABC transporter ATP-binding protein [Polyangiaceae bacterium]|nr:ABC transporter ATP-binding protein [Polyangiaceae bacterium]
MSFLELEDVSKGYSSAKGAVPILANVSLSIREREFVAVLGFSGSGKTTLMSLIAGLARPDRGSVRLRGKPITGPGRERGVVFQNYSLLPWLSAYENVALAVESAFPEWSRERRRAHGIRYLEMVNLGHALHKKPKELSGGMRQRVAVARALAMQPEVLLLDEPLSALDALTRGSLQREIERIWAEEHNTVVLVTNDVDEALLLADRIVPLTPGPKATLGTIFDVGVPRPRDRRSVNHDPEFKRLRNRVIGYLNGLRAGARPDGEMVDAVPGADVAPALVGSA